MHNTASEECVSHLYNIYTLSIMLTKVRWIGKFVYYIDYYSILLNKKINIDVDCNIIFCVWNMIISVVKIDTLVLSRTLPYCSLHVSRTSLRQERKFKYLGVIFTSDGMSEAKQNTRISGADTVLCQPQHSNFRRREINEKAKLTTFNSVFMVMEVG